MGGRPSVLGRVAATFSGILGIALDNVRKVVGKGRRGGKDLDKEQKRSPCAHGFSPFLEFDSHMRLTLPRLKQKGDSEVGSSTPHSPSTSHIQERHNAGTLESTRCQNINSIDMQCTATHRNDQESRTDTVCSASPKIHIRRCQASGAIRPFSYRILASRRTQDGTL